MRSFDFRGALANPSSKSRATWRSIFGTQYPALVSGILAPSLQIWRGQKQPRTSIIFRRSSTKHKVTGCYTVDVNQRSFIQIDSLVVRWPPALYGAALTKRTTSGLQLVCPLVSLKFSLAFA